MPIANVECWSQFGLPGLIIAALLALIVLFMREHKAERCEWLQAYRDQSRMADERQAETNEVIRDLTGVIRELNANRRA